MKNLIKFMVLLPLLVTMMLITSCTGTKNAIADSLSRAVYISDNNDYSLSFNGIDKESLTYSISDLNGSEIISGKYEIEFNNSDEASELQIWVVSLIGTNNQFSIQPKTLKLPDIIIINDIKYHLIITYNF